MTFGTKPEIDLAQIRAALAAGAAPGAGAGLPGEAWRIVSWREGSNESCLRASRCSKWAHTLARGQLDVDQPLTRSISRRDRPRGVSSIGAHIDTAGRATESNGDHVRQGVLSCRVNISASLAKAADRTSRNSPPRMRFAARHRLPAGRGCRREIPPKPPEPNPSALPIAPPHTCVSPGLP